MNLRQVIVQLEALEKQFPKNDVSVLVLRATGSVLVFAENGKDGLPNLEVIYRETLVFPKAEG